MGGVLFGLLLIIVIFFILYMVVQSAVDSSDMHKTLKEVKSLLEANQRDGLKDVDYNKQDVGEADEADDIHEEIIEEECPACGSKVNSKMYICPNCGLTLKD